MYFPYFNKLIFLFGINFFYINFVNAQIDTIIIKEIHDSILVDYNSEILKDTNSKNLIIQNINSYNNSDSSSELTESEELIIERLKILDKSSPMDFSYNEHTKYYINRYLNKDVKLISRMLGLSQYYFPMIEEKLDKYQIPLELKYLSIVESALNPKAKSWSGATGLWQFMYPTGKEYGLEVTSYIDERQDPIKSTEAACIYFQSLFDMFGDWNLVLAAYNGGPGYLNRLIAKTEISDYWNLRPFLRKETQGYVPKFIALSYVMYFHKDHNIDIYNMNMSLSDADTISLNEQSTYELISDYFCIPIETIRYLNPSFKKDILPKGEYIYLPDYVIMDIVRNEDYFYEYLSKVENKEILINETRLVYMVEKGDYLGKIAKKYNLRVSDLRQWNNLISDNLSIDQKLILYIPHE